MDDARHPGPRRSSIGRYVVLEEVGRGGMGRVFRAYDPKLQREVALKEVRREEIGLAGAQRLVAEARAMAKLSHPNVVAVYDVEEIGDGEVVLVMEYVAGRTLTAWMRDARSWQEIVELFRQAGRGLAAAHDAGLLHRDFKPDNVLVGSEGRVRVTDFGLAREIVPSRTGELAEIDATVTAIEETSTRTAAGAIVGTLPYLAPERLMGAPADEATDQFAYCVSLWEALFGERPFPGRSVGELAFALSAGPPRPPAGGRRVPAWLLEVITRGLDGDPARRWPRMHALLVALSRDPAQRRRRWLQAGLAAGVLGISTAAVQAWSAGREQRCTDEAAAAHLQGAWDDTRRAEVRDAVLGIGFAYASEVWTRTERALDEYADAWTRMHVETCEATTLRGEQSTAAMDLRMACLHRANVELSAVTRVLGHADAQTVERAHDLVASLRPLARCADIDALQAEVEPPLPADADAVERTREHLAVARAGLRAGHLDDARRALVAADTEIADVRYGPVRAELALVRGRLLDHAGDYAEAEAALREALRIAASERESALMQDAAASLLLVVGVRLQRFDEGLRYADVAQGLAEGDAEREARVLTNLGNVLDAQGKYAEADASHRSALALREATLGPVHPDVVESRSNLAAVAYARGEYETAEIETRRALALREELFGPEHPAVGQSRHTLALVLHARGRLVEAEAEHRRALALREAALGPAHPDVATTRSNLAAVLQAQGKLAEAEAEHRRAIAVSEAALGPEHADVAGCRNDLAIALATQGKNAEAAAEFRRALAVLEKVLGPAHPQVAQSHHNLANVHEDMGDLEEAETEHRRALAVLEAAFDADHPKLAAARTSLARLLLERGESDEARRLAEIAWARRQRDDIPAGQRAHTAFVLAQAWWTRGSADDRRRALELARRAHTDYGDSEDAAIVASWIADRSP